MTAPPGVRPKSATELYLSPNCRTALDPYVPDDWPDGHPKCGHPGYQHPVLGWMAIPCTCSCHTVDACPQDQGEEAGTDA